MCVRKRGPGRQRRDPRRQGCGRDAEGPLAEAGVGWGQGRSTVRPDRTWQPMCPKRVGTAREAAAEGAAWGGPGRDPLSLAAGRAPAGWKVEQQTSTGQETKDSEGSEAESIYLSGSRPVPELSLEPRGAGEGVGSGLRLKALPRKGTGQKVGSGAVGWGVIGGGKVDGLESLEMRTEGERKWRGRGTCRPEEPASQALAPPIRGCSLGDPQGSPPQARLRTGPEELTYFGAEAALGRAEEASRGGGVSTRTQQAAERVVGAGDMVRLSGQRAKRAPRPGPSPGVAPPLPRAPLSSVGTEFGCPEALSRGDEGIGLGAPVCSSPLSVF